MVPYPSASAVVEEDHPHLSEGERLSEAAIAHVLASDTVWFGTTYVAAQKDAERYPSHLGINHRGGRPGFTRVKPSDGRTVVLPDFSGKSGHSWCCVCALLTLLYVPRQSHHDFARQCRGYSSSMPYLYRFCNWRYSLHHWQCKEFFRSGCPRSHAPTGRAHGSLRHRLHVCAQRSAHTRQARLQDSTKSI